jgi:ribosome biogenesis GTPase
LTTCFGAALGSHAEGRIVRALSGFYYVKTVEGIYQCRARGIFKKVGISPLVGDRVVIDIQDEEEGWIVEMLPRKNEFIRPPVSNIDLFAVVIAAAKPSPNMEILDRFLVTAEAADVDAIICINKIDLEKTDKNVIRDYIKTYGSYYKVFPVSAVTGDGVEEFKAELSGKNVAFAGPSGAGKSSLTAVISGCDMQTGSVSRKTGRGKNTTRHVEIVGTDFGADIFDTPGYTSFESVVPDTENPGWLFPEIARYAGQCRFDNCKHIEEPDCVVKAMVDKGEIASSRYNSYRRILNEIEARLKEY